MSGLLALWGHHLHAARRPEDRPALPGDPLDRGDGIAAHTLVALRVQGIERFVARSHQAGRQPGVGLLGGVGRSIAHHFGAAGDHAVFHPAHHRGGGEVDRGDPATAEAIERGAAGGDVIPGGQRRHPAQIAALLAVLRRARPDDVVDRGGIDAVAVADRLEHRHREVLGVQMRKRALAGLADPARGADCIDDIGFGHVGSP